MILAITLIVILAIILVTAYEVYKNMSNSGNLDLSTSNRFYKLPRKKPGGGVEETIIVGDVTIEFLLSKDGALRARIFNRENEFQYFGDELGYTQGIGLSYRVGFDDFKSLIKKIVKKNAI